MNSIDSSASVTTFTGRLAARMRSYKKPFLILYLYVLLLNAPLLILRLTNSEDGLWNQDDYMAGSWELSIGRWFWPVLDKLRFGISLDPLPALASLALYVLSFLLILEILGLRPFYKCDLIHPIDQPQSVHQQQPVHQQQQIHHAALANRSVPFYQTPHNGLIYLMGALFLSSVGITCQMSFGYMALTFGCSFLLAVLAVWVLICFWERCLPSVLLSAVCIGLMMGLYQAGIGTTCLLCLFVLIYSAMRERITSSDTMTARSAAVPAASSPSSSSSAKEVCFVQELPVHGNYNIRTRIDRISFTMRALLSTAIGGVLYIAFLKLCLAVTGTQASDYQGFSSISPAYIMAGLPSALKHCYAAAQHYFADGVFCSNRFIGGKWIWLCYLPVLVIVIRCIAAILGSRKRPAAAAVLVFLGILLSPIAANIFYIVAPETETHMQMTVSMGLILPMILGLGNVMCTENKEEAPADRNDGSPTSSAGKIGSAGQRRDKLQKGAFLLTAACSALLLYGNILQCATDQYAMYAGRSATQTLAESILSEANRLGYDLVNGQLLITDSPYSSKTFQSSALYQEANSYAQYGNWSHTESYSRVSWSKFYTNYLRLNVSFAVGDTEETIASLPEVAAMPSYPAAGSVQNIYGVLVVKLGQ